jgi:hypothetical protein
MAAKFRPKSANPTTPTDPATEAATPEASTPSAPTPSATPTSTSSSTSSSTPAVDPVPAPAATPTPGTRARLRASATKVSLMLVAAFVVGGIGARITGPDETASPPRLPAEAETTTVDGPTQATEILGAARRYALDNPGLGFRGFRHPGLDPALMAASSDTFVFGLRSGTDCWYSGIVPPAPLANGEVSTGSNADWDGVSNPRVELDDTVEQLACVPATFETAQQVLDTEANAAAVETGAEIGETLTSAAQSLSIWATMVFDSSGRPTFHGLETVPVPGVAVVAVAPDGQSVVLRVEQGTTCNLATFTVGHDGQPPALEPC